VVFMIFHALEEALTLLMWGLGSFGGFLRDSALNCLMRMQKPRLMVLLYDFCIG
jgi:hypothetical protein